MKTVRSIDSTNSYRIPPRLKLVATRLGSLLLLFQRMPVVQFLFPQANIIGGASVANSVSLAVTTVVGLGLFDSVAGQSQINQKTPLAVTGKTPAGASPTAANAINVPATVAAPLTFGFNWDPSDQYSTVKSFRTTYNSVVGTLPPGLSPAAVASGLPTAIGATHTISGTVTTPGIYPVTVSVYRNTNYASTVASQIFNICVLGFSTQPTAITAISSGATATLTCVAAGKPVATTFHTATANLTYEWYEGTTGTIGTILGTSASFTTPPLSSSKNYWVRIKSVLGTSTVYANSNTAAVNVTVPPNVSIAVAPASVTEDGAGDLVYTFTRTGATTAALTASFSVTGSASFPADYAQSGAAGFTASNGTVTIPAGSTTVAVTLNPTVDITVESDETAVLTVVSGAGYAVGAPSEATGTIANDDTAYSSWASVLPADQKGPLQTPQNDSVTNLEKFAFNMNPTAPDVRRLTVGGSEIAGLPGGGVVGGKLRIEFLRRKADTTPGITYLPQFCSVFGIWDDFTGVPVSVTSIDSTWERVVVDDPAAGSGKRFGRVRIDQL